MKTTVEELQATIISQAVQLLRLDTENSQLRDSVSYLQKKLETTGSPTEEKDGSKSV